MPSWKTLNTKNLTRKSMKLRSIYICTKCSYETPQWLGRCPQCESWESFTEEVVNTGKSENETEKNTTSRIATRLKASIPASAPRTLHEMRRPQDRIVTNMTELDTVLGGGFVVGSLTLLSGEPGIGKSTLTLQICANIAKQNKRIFSFSGEESIEQVALRAHRLGIQTDNITLFNETSLENIISLIEENKPDFVIIDSIQVIASENLPGSAGSMNQVRACSEALLHTAKLLNVAIMLIGHVTKDGTLAGPRTLEHLVDTVLSIEGDRYHSLRLLRSAKNRFGSTNEVALFEMTSEGLRQVDNPSSLLLEGRVPNAIGSCLTITIEGTRPFIIEVQALTTLTSFGYPKRTANGFDLNRLQMIIAILQEHANINLVNQDIFINIVGGMTIQEPAGDLAVALAILSAYRKKPLGETIAFGELGLTGEIRNVAQSGKREKEAEKLGFTNIVTSKTCKKIAQITITKLEQALD